MTLLAVVIAQAPVVPGTPVWVSLAIAGIGVIGGGLGWNIYMRWRKGSQEDAIEISNAAIDQAKNAQSMFVQYSIELEAAKKQIADYLDRLIEVNRLYGEANSRIHRLESELELAKAEHDIIKRSLDQALGERESADKQREALIEQIAILQTRVTELTNDSIASN